jgi:hypothetical protein
LSASETRGDLAASGVFSILHSVKHPKDDHLVGLAINFVNDDVRQFLHEPLAGSHNETANSCDHPLSGRPPLSFAWRTIEISAGLHMRVSDTLLDTVVFLGYPTDAPGKGGIDCIGTGFLLFYDGVPHLVTVRHVAEQFGEDPFLIRVNRFDRSGENIPIDGVRWFFDSDPTTDVAVIPFDLSPDYA